MDDIAIIPALFVPVLAILWAIAIWRRATGRRHTNLPILIAWRMYGAREVESPRPPDDRPAAP